MGKLTKRLVRTGPVTGCSLALVAAFAQHAVAEEGVIEEIVVTARQRTESIQDVPISMSAVGGSALEEARINSLQEMEYSVPNLVFGETGTSGETHVGIRGIGDFSRNIGFDTRVGVYVDGVFAGQSLAVDQGLADVEQVEVLRGPQGTLFGKNSSSGVINIITRKPDFDAASADVSVGAGNDSNLYGSAAINLPLSDTVAARVSVMAQEQDGYVDNLANGKELMSADYVLTRGRLRFQPNDALDVTLSVDYREQNNDILFLEPEDSYELAVGNPAAVGRHNVDQDGPLTDDNNGWGLALAGDYDFGNGWILTSISGYRESERKVGSDEDATSAYGLHVAYFKDDLEQFTQELRIASPATDRFRYVAGFYYFWQQGAQLRDVLLGPAFGAPADTLGARSDSEVETTSWAGFVNANYDLTERVTLNAGIRYTQEDKKADLNQFTLGAFGLANFTDYSDDFDKGNVTATANVQYAINEDVMAYANYSRGQKSGGWNVDFVASLADLPFDEETVDSFEVGIKSDLLDGRLRLNASAFHAEYKDFQVFQFQFTGTTTNLIVSNAAEVTTQGVEVEGTAYLTDDLEVDFGIGFADAEFDDFPGGATDDLGNPVNVGGNDLVRAPKWTSSITGRYHFVLGDMDGSVAVNYTYRDKEYFNPDNREQSRQNGYGLWNASADLNLSAQWQVGVWGRNLGDKEYRTMRGVSFLGVPFSLYARKISYGLEARFRF